MSYAMAYFENRSGLLDHAPNSALWPCLMALDNALYYIRVGFSRASKHASIGILARRTCSSKDQPRNSIYFRISRRDTRRWPDVRFASNSPIRSKLYPFTASPYGRRRFSYEYRSVGRL